MKFERDTFGRIFLPTPETRQQLIEVVTECVLQFGHADGLWFHNDFAPYENLWDPFHKSTVFVQYAYSTVLKAMIRIGEPT